MKFKILRQGTVSNNEAGMVTISGWDIETTDDAAKDNPLRAVTLAAADFLDHYGCAEDAAALRRETSSAFITVHADTEPSDPADD